MVTEALARGGAERQMLALTHGLLQRGYDVQVFELSGTAPGQPSFASEFGKMGIRLRSPSEFSCSDKRDVANTQLCDLQPFAPLLPANGASVCRALLRVIQEFGPSIVNCWSDLSNLIGGVVSTRMRVPRIVLGQRVSIAPFWFDAHEADLYRQAYRVLAGNPSVVFVNNSRSSAKEYERWIQLATGTNKIVHNGFLPSSIKIRSRSESAACRASLGLPANKPVVGALMRFAPEKDPDLWLETAAAIASVRSDVYFLLAGYGHGAIADQLLQKGAERDLGSRLVVPGVVTDVGQVYGALDVHFLTSRTENLPNVMIEAQAAGIPVVGPDVGGIGEAMIDGVTGVLVRDRSAGALARAVLRILDDPRWRERAAVEGPIFVSRTFDQERMIREMIAIYRGQQPVWRRWLKWPTRSLSKIDSSPTSARFVYRGSREQDRYRGQPLPAEPQRLTSHRDAEAMKTNRPIELGDGTTVPAGAAVIFVRGYGYAIRDPHLYGIDKHVAAYHYVFVQPIAVDGKERQ